MSTDTAHDLALALTLPHLGMEERVAFLADHAAVAAINAYGPKVARRFVREAAGVISSPTVVEMMRSMLAARGIPGNALDIVFDVLREGASSVGGDDGPVTDPPMPPASYTRASFQRQFMRLGDDGVVVLSDGALVLTQKLSLLSPDEVTPVVEGMTHRTIECRSSAIGGLIGDRRVVRLMAIVPTKEGHKIPLDTEVLTRFVPGRCHGLDIESLLTLSDDALNTEFVLDEKSALNVAIARDDQTREIQAIITAVYRPANAAAPEGDAATPPAAAEAQGAPEGNTGSPAPEAPASAPAKVRRARKRRVA